MEGSNLYLYLAVTLILLFYMTFKNYLRSVIVAFKTPGPKPIPILGNVSFLTDSKKFVDSADKLYEWYGPILRCWMSIVPSFIISEPEYIKKLLGTNKYSDKNILYRCMNNFLGQGLITSTGQKWKVNRKCLQPSFNNNVLKVFYSTFHEHSAKFVTQLKEQSNINVTERVNKYVLDVLYDVVLGMEEYDIDSSPFRNGKLMLLERIKRPWLLFDSFFNMTSGADREMKQKMTLQEYTRKVLEDKQRDPSLNGHRINFMEIMMDVVEQDPNFTDDDIVQEASTLMLAGQDSVGAGIAFAMYFIAKHQDVQEKIMQELNTIFQGSDRDATFEDIGEMRYLEQCIKESMRLCPSVTAFGRKLTQDVTLGKTTLPQGTNIFVAPFWTHRLPHIFPDPLKYDPDRFSPNNENKIHPFGFIPFSAGPRNCIGSKFGLIEIKSIISETLRSYRLSLMPGKEELNLIFRVTLRARGGIWLNLEKRTISVN